MHLLRRLLLATTALLCLAGCKPTRPPQPPVPAGSRAYVVHHLGVISVLEPAGRSITVLPGRLWQNPSDFPTLTDIAVLPDGATALVPSGRQNLVYAVDLYDGRVASAIPVDGAPEEIVLTRDGRRAYVTTTRPVIEVIDTRDNSIRGEIDVGNPTAGLGGAGTIDVSANGRYVCALTKRADLVMIDTAGDRIVRTLPLSGAPVGLALTPDGRGAWVSGFPENAVTLVDLSSGKVLEAFPTGDKPRGLAITPDGHWLFVANSSGSSITVIDAASRKPATSIAVAPGPTALTVTRDGAFILVAHPDANTLTVLDTATRSVAYAMHEDIVQLWPRAIGVP